MRLRTRFLIGGAVTAAAGLAAALAFAAITPTPVVTRKGWQYFPSAAPGGAYVAYTEFRHGHGTLYVRPQGQPRFAVNTKGTAYNWGFDAGKVAYQQVNPRGTRSRILLYDIAGGTKSQPDGVNTGTWQYEPSISADWVLFGRTTAHRFAVLLHNTTTAETRLLSRHRRRDAVLDPGQVNGTWATFSVYNKHTRVSNTFRYDIAGPATDRIRLPDNRSQYSSSIAPNGTLFYVRSKLGCGKHVVIRENVAGGADTPLVSLPAGYDVYHTFLVDEGGGFTLYYDQASCTTNRSDIYSIPVS
jgi:Tol biopolymer transport system component